MDIRPLTPDYAVSPQIEPTDIAAIQAAGYVAIICNRPDAEIPPNVRAAPMREAALAAGLGFVEIPVVHSEITPELLADHRAAIEGAGGPVLAYCASGTRSTVVWMLGAAPETDPDQLLAAARAAGYDLEQLRPQLTALHRG